MTGIVDGLLDLADLLGSLIRATPPSRRMSAGHPLERHHGARARVLRDARLLGIDDVHDDAALQHLGETCLDPQRPVLGHRRSLAACRTIQTPVDTAVGLRPNCGFRDVEIAWRRSCPSARCGIGTCYRRDSSPRRRHRLAPKLRRSASGPPTRVLFADRKPANAGFRSAKSLKRDCFAVAVVSSGGRPLCPLARSKAR